MGPERGLALIDEIDDLDGYHLYHSARADLLRRRALGRSAQGLRARSRPRWESGRPLFPRAAPRRARVGWRLGATLAPPARPAETMIYIWVRATADWESEAASWQQLPPVVKASVETWNETFDMPFHRFRYRVREIARLNLSRVEHAVCAEWAAIPGGELVMPVDDDDWFAPDAATILEAEREPEVTAYHWVSSFLEMPTSFRHRLHLIARHTVGLPMPYLFTTNSYALVKRPDTAPLLVSHTAASDWAQSASPGSLKKIERYLSLMNRTLGSQTQLARLNPALSRFELIHKLRRYRRLYRRAPRRELEWSAPYRAMMAELMDEIRVKHR